MLKWAIILALVGLVLGGLGFSGVAGGFEAVAKILFVLFLIGAVIMFLVGSFVVKKVV